jgi:hypothetical protein
LKRVNYLIVSALGGGLKLIKIENFGLPEIFDFFAAFKKDVCV